MSNIQSNINQLIGTGAIIAGLYANSPAGKDRSEIRKLNRSIEKGEAKQKGDIQAVDKGAITNEQFRSNLAKSTKEQADRYEELAQKDPTIENIQKAALAKDVAIVHSDEAWKQFEEAMQKSGVLPEAKPQGNKHMQNIGKQQVNQKQSYLDYFKSLSGDDKRDMLKQTQHIRAQEKRGNE